VTSRFDPDGTMHAARGQESTGSGLQAHWRTLAPSPFNKAFLANVDQWDGYGSVRDRLLGYLREDGVSNIVALTGDIHAFAAGVVEVMPERLRARPVRLVETRCDQPLPANPVKGVTEIIVPAGEESLQVPELET